MTNKEKLQEAIALFEAGRKYSKMGTIKINLNEDGYAVVLSALRDQLQRETEPVPLTDEQEIQNAFFAMVVAERSAQDHKWGRPQLNTLCEWGSYLAEECGEAIRELNDLNFGKGDKEKLVTELVHTAAMCLAILQQYDTAVEVTRQKRDFVYAAREPKGEATT